jgi:hypothetical protein
MAPKRHLHTASESEDGGGRDVRQHGNRRVRKPRDKTAACNQRWPLAQGAGVDANAWHLSNIPRSLLESIVKVDEGISSVINTKVHCTMPHSSEDKIMCTFGEEKVQST